MTEPSRNLAPWSGRGGETLRSLREVPVGHRVALLIRHAAREVGPPSLPSHPLEEEWPLTPLGRVDARRFGRELPSFDHLYLTHTPKERTRDTAAEIGAGFRESFPSSKVAAEGVDPGIALTKYYATDPALRDQWFQDLGFEFYDAWQSGRVPPRVMRPVGEAVADLNRRIRAKLERAPASALHVAVTHDVTIALIRDVLFGAPSAPRPPVEYLEGILLTWDAEGAPIARWREETVRTG